jgi:hypothetical protein
MANIAAARVAAHVRAILDQGNAAWGGFARARGLHFTPAVAGWMGAKTALRIDGTDGGVTFSATLYPDHESGYFGTAIVVFPVRPTAGHFEVTRAGTLSRVATAFGAQDLLMGSPAFDDAFVVKATNEATARHFLSPSVCAEILSLGAHFVGYDDGREPLHTAHMLLEIPGLVTDGALFDRAVHCMTRLAGDTARRHATDEA